MSLQRVKRVVATLACLTGVALFCPISHAQIPNVAGSYECTQVRAQGKVTPCRSAPLVLKKDGSFELRGWEGNYVVSGDWVELSDSLLKSRAKLEPGHKIIFHYHSKGGVIEVIYERRLAVLGKTSLS